MEDNKKNTMIFNDKRLRETRLLQSVRAFDGTDFMMEQKSARRLSTEKNDDIDISSVSSNSNTSADWNVWNKFRISPNNLRNVMNKGNNNSGEIKTVPELPSEKEDANTVATADLSYASNNSSPQQVSASSPTSTPLATTPEETATTTAESEPSEPQHPRWFNRLKAVSLFERRQDKAYSDAIEKRHDEANATARNDNSKNDSNQKKNYRRRWYRRGSTRDGMDFSRDVALARYHDSIRAMADSYTDLSSNNSLHPNGDNNGDDNGTDDAVNHRGGFFQHSRAVPSPKMKECVLDLVA
mmetsp:Transcript_9055/g.20725  ORF Transcript_9055/g.20725 Transcript_9055/m.20725 type:complete len:298 (+) Transcript_9055:171-1064(+)